MVFTQECASGNVICKISSIVFLGQYINKATNLKSSHTITHLQEYVENKNKEYINIIRKINVNNLKSNKITTYLSQDTEAGIFCLFSIKHMHSHFLHNKYISLPCT